MNDTTPPSAPAKRRPAARKRKPAAKKAASASAATSESPVAQVAAEGATAQAAAPEPPIAPGLIRVPMSVRWRDLDAFNHVNNSKYLSYLEEARLRWMMTLPGMGLDDDVAPVVAASNLNYRRPIGWPGEVTVELFVERIGNTSLSIGHRIIDGDNPKTVYCDGNVVMVWIDRQSGKAATLPRTVRDACDVATGGSERVDDVHAAAG